MKDYIKQLLKRKSKVLAARQRIRAEGVTDLITPKMHGRINGHINIATIATGLLKRKSRLLVLLLVWEDKEPALLYNGTRWRIDNLNNQLLILKSKICG